MEETNTDLVISIFNTGTLPPLLGSFSRFVDQAHPGTSKKLTGWEWDLGNWKFDQEEEAGGIAPVLFDIDTSALEDRFFQSGIGSEADLEVLGLKTVHTVGLYSGPSHWAPTIKHGYYFIQRRRSYLFADGYITNYLASGSWWPGTTLARIALTETPKPGIPIQVRSWIYNRDEGRYLVDIDFRKKADFTGLQSGSTRLPTRDSITRALISGNVDRSRPEFVLEEDTAAPGEVSVVLNSSYSDEVGIELPSVALLGSLENIGITVAQDTQVHNTTYSPIDRTRPVHVYTFPDTRDAFTAWTAVDEITGPGQAAVDYDLGLIRFSSVTGSRPPAEHHIGVHYTRSVSVEYEPEGIPDTMDGLEPSADVNPIGRATNRGFIFIRDRALSPGSIHLFAEAPIIETDVFGPINIGSSYVPVRATVRAEFTGELMEGESVTFEIVDQTGIDPGSFSSGGRSASSITNRNGTASVFYSPPRSINDISYFSTSVAAGPPGRITIPGVTIPNTDLTRVHIYKVFDNDPVMGKALDTAARRRLDWEEFFKSEDINGPTGLADLADVFAIGQEDQLWEFRHRVLMGLLVPRAYNRMLRNGQKQIVSVFDSAAINPRNGLLGAFRPLTPSSMSYSGGNTLLDFSGVTLDVPRGPGPSADLDGYLVVAPPNRIQVRASVFNARTGSTVLSNPIYLSLAVPAWMSGTVFIDDINALPAALVSWVLEAAHNNRTLPLGFRIRSPGVTLAAALGGVTYLNINRDTTRLDMGFMVEV